MTKGRSINGLLVAAAAAVLAVPMAATAENAPAATFRDFEHHYAGEARVAAARASLARLVPAGTSLDEARTTLETAGAHCGRPERCSFGAFEANHDMLNSVAWTVDLHHDDGRVSALSVRRETYGS